MPLIKKVNPHNTKKSRESQSKGEVGAQNGYLFAFGLDYYSRMCDINRVLQTVSGIRTEVSPQTAVSRQSGPVIRALGAGEVADHGVGKRISPFRQ